MSTENPLINILKTAISAGVNRKTFDIILTDDLLPYVNNENEMADVYRKHPLLYAIHYGFITIIHKILPLTNIQYINGYIRQDILYGDTNINTKIKIMQFIPRYILKWEYFYEIELFIYYFCLLCSNLNNNYSIEDTHIILKFLIKCNYNMNFKIHECINNRNYFVHKYNIKNIINSCNNNLIKIKYLHTFNYMRGYQQKYKYIFLCKHISRNKN